MKKKQRVKTISRPATEHGWLLVQRADETCPHDVWEKPDGQLVASPAGEMPRLVSIEKNRE